MEYRKEIKNMSYDDLIKEKGKHMEALVRLNVECIKNGGEETHAQENIRLRIEEYINDVNSLLTMREMAKIISKTIVSKKLHEK